MADRELTSTQTRILVGAVVALLAGVGIVWSIDAIGGDPDRRAAPSPSPSPSVAPTAVDPDQVEDWFPHTPEEFAQAGAHAQRFATELATVDSSAENFTRYTERLGAMTTSGYASALATEEGGAAGPWRVLAAEESVSWTGRATVEEIRYYDSRAITYTVSVIAEPTAGGEKPKDLGEYAVTVRSHSDGWKIERAEPAEPR